MTDADVAGLEELVVTSGGEAALGVRSPTPHQLHPTAQKILAAARKLLIERGYQSMTLQAISTEAQVNKAGVWYYFGGKQQLVLAVLEDVFVRESLHFGTIPPAEATLAERCDLVVGSVGQIRERVRRFRAFYELLPEASRDAELHGHLMAYYQSWYEWAQAVLAPAGEPGAGGGAPEASGGSEAHAGRGALGQYASILLDGIIVQMIVATPDFDLDAALDHARRSLLLVAGDAS